MYICDICYAELQGDKDGICEKCRLRKSPKELKEEKVPDEEIIERFKELMALREENIELLIEKLRSMSKKYNLI